MAQGFAQGGLRGGWRPRRADLGKEGVREGSAKEPGKQRTMAGRGKLPVVTVAVVTFACVRTWLGGNLMRTVRVDRVLRTWILPCTYGRPQKGCKQ